jgi:hypothetical protein
MMDSVNVRADEIVTSCDAALTYSYIHLMRKARDEELERAMRMLATTHGLIGSNIFGYDTVNSNSTETCEFIEDHPGFKTLVHHEESLNENFHRWTARGYPGVNCGYNLLKAKLLASHTSSQGVNTSTRRIRDIASSGEGGVGGETPDEDKEEDEPMPRAGAARANNDRSKRQRTGSPSGTSRNLVSLDIMMDKMAATLSSVVTAAISSSGSDRNAEREGARTSIQQEQRRREQAENEVRVLRIEMDRKISEERHNIEMEIGRKYKEGLETKVSFVSAQCLTNI